MSKAPGSADMPNIFEEQRKRLVYQLISEGYIKSEKVARAMLTVPREEFVPQHYRRYAYHDTPLPTMKGQTISAPHMCAMMCEALDLKEGHIVLEVGTGSGYHAALCAEIVAPSGSAKRGHVYTVELFKELAAFAYENLRRTGYDDRVTVITCDGSFAIPLRIKFDRILVTAAAPKIPRALLKVLKTGGIMVIPVGSHFYQELQVIRKIDEEKISVKSLGGCLFVKLVGKDGFELDLF